MLMKNFTERAYAKVNFNLRVLPCRTDGYHSIESIFQTVDLYDELEVTLSESTGCFVECNSLKLPLQNTLTNAYDAFCSVAGVKVPGVTVNLKKGIPAGGGPLRRRPRGETGRSVDDRVFPPERALLGVCG